MKNDLANFQKNFVEFITTGESSVPKINPIKNSTKNRSLEVYQTDYFSRLTEALGSSYEACWLVLGDEDFFDVARKYINKFPSNLKSLNFYGKDFPQFLDEHYQDEFPFLMDLANFEKSYWTLFHSSPSYLKKDHIEFDESIFSRQFHLNPTLQIYHWNFRLYDLWKKKDASLGDLSFEDIEKPQTILRFKEQNIIAHLEMDHRFIDIIVKVQNGLTLETIMESSKDEEDLHKLSGDDWSRLFHLLARLSIAA